jgi:predicted PurR-regulated permease PerM
MFWLVGCPRRCCGGAVMFVLSFLPVVGAGLVWAPAACYLALAGDWAGATLLVGWGVLSFLVVDNVIYARLAGGGCACTRSRRWSRSWAGWRCSAHRG